MSLRFTGGAQLARNLDALSTRVSRKIQREALQEAAEPIRLTMQQMAPREAGAPDLADNMVISTSRSLGNAVAVAIGPAKAFFYGFYQEYGTSRHRPQPFARPSYDRHVRGGATLNLIAAALWRSIARVAGGSRGSGGGGVGL